MKQGWKIDQLGNLCTFNRGLTYSKKDEVDVSENIVLRATNISLENNRLDFSELKYINETINIPEPKRVKKGSLLICTASGSKSHLGKVAFIDNDYGYAFGGFMGQLIPSEKIFPRYFYYRMISEDYRDFIGKLSDGVNINNLKYSQLESFTIPYPSLNEQIRIVAKLDECFEAIDKARANVEKNLQNAKDLFQSQLKQIFSQKGDGWEEQKLGEALLIERGGSPRPIKKYLTDSPDGLNWIKISDATASDKYIYKTKQKITKDGLHKTRLVNEGDFLLSNSMSFGRPYIMKTSGCIHDGWLVLRDNGTCELSKEFLYYLLCSPNLFEQFDGMAAGSTVRNLNIALVSSVKVFIPELKTQELVASKLDKLSIKTKSLETNYQQELDALDELKKSILQKAFNGEL